MKRWFLAGLIAIVVCMVTVSPFEFSLFFSSGQTTYSTQSLGKGAWLKVIRVGYGATTPDSYDVYVTDNPGEPTENSLVCALSHIDNSKKFLASWDLGKIRVQVPPTENLVIQLRNHVPLQGKFVPVTLMQLEQEAGK